MKAVWARTPASRLFSDRLACCATSRLRIGISVFDLHHFYLLPCLTLVQFYPSCFNALFYEGRPPQASVAPRKRSLSPSALLSHATDCILHVEL